MIPAENIMIARNKRTFSLHSNYSEVLFIHCCYGPSQMPNKRKDEAHWLVVNN